LITAQPVCLNRNTHVTDADAMRFLPCEQQLHPQFDGLLWVPPGSFPEHHDAWRERTEPRRSRVPDYGSAVCLVPHNYYLGSRSFQSCFNWLRADQCPCHCNLRSCHIGNNYALTIARRIAEIRMPLDDLAADQSPTHAAAGASFAAANCATCHTTVNFTTATFDHGTTGFALTDSTCLLHRRPAFPVT